jgi:ABC-type antimicrobial peptide transport system permease subunit
MKLTLIKIDYEKGSPLDIEINGNTLTGTAERAIFYLVAALVALGAGWAIFNILLPLIWFIFKLLFSIIGFGLIILGVIAAAAIIFGIFKWKRGERNRNGF